MKTSMCVLAPCIHFNEYRPQLRCLSSALELLQVSHLVWIIYQHANDGTVTSQFVSQTGEVGYLVRSHGKAVQDLRVQLGFLRHSWKK